MSHRSGLVLTLAAAAAFCAPWRTANAQRLAPGPSADDRVPGPAYRHHHGGEDNGDAHLKSLLVGHEVIVPVTKGRLDLGPWQQIFYYEFDGRRRKRLIMKALGA